MGITSGQLATLLALVTAWSFILGAIIEGVKRAVLSAGGARLSSLTVRLLPLASMVLGALTGLFALELIFELIGLALSAGSSSLLPYTGAFIGIGAGAVAGQVVKTYKQTLLGQDSRLDAKDDHAGL